jgi:DNA replication protein DnaC
MNREDIDVEALLRRLHLPTVRRLLPELETRAAAEGWSHRDFVAVLVAEEVAHRNGTRVSKAVRNARFPFVRTIEDFDFVFQSTLRRQALGPFLGPELVSEGRNLVLSGKPGRGKTHVAIAVAYRAIQNGHDARFITAADLIDTLSAAAKQGRLRDATAEFVAPHVLVIDEVGYLHHADDAANVLFGVVDQRYLRKRPIILTTNKRLSAWGEVLHDPDLAEVILDRILERGVHLSLGGPSWRRRHLPESTEAELDAASPPVP